MTVYRGPGGVWRVEFQLAGVRVHRSARTRDRRAAEALEAKLREEVHARKVLGRRPPPEPMTWGHAAARYVREHLRPSSRESNLRKDEWVLSRLTRFLGEGRQLGEIGSAEVASLKAHLVRNGAGKGTVNRQLTILRAVLRKAHREWEAIPSVPVFKLYGHVGVRVRTLSREEERRLFLAAERNPQLLRLLRFLLATGARLGEALALTWERVSLEHASRRPHVIFERTKNGTTRSVPLSPALVEMLDGMRASPEVALDVHVFLCLRDGPDGRELVPYRHPHYAFDRARREAGISDFRIHDLRHTCASRLVQQGVSLYTVGKLLGHRDPRMTARYAHLAEGGLDALADLL